MNENIKAVREAMEFVITEMFKNQGTLIGSVEVARSIVALKTNAVFEVKRENLKVPKLPPLGWGMLQDLAYGFVLVTAPELSLGGEFFVIKYDQSYSNEFETCIGYFGTPFAIECLEKAIFLTNSD